MLRICLAWQVLQAPYIYNVKPSFLNLLVGVFSIASITKGMAISVTLPQIVHIWWQ